MWNDALNLMYGSLTDQIGENLKNQPSWREVRRKMEKVAYNTLKECFQALLYRKLATLSEVKLKSDVEGKITAVMFLSVLFKSPGEATCPFFHSLLNVVEKH